MKIKWKNGYGEVIKEDKEEMAVGTALPISQLFGKCDKKTTEKEKPIIKIREISEEELKERMKNKKIIKINSEEDIEKFFKELDEK